MLENFLISSFISPNLFLSLTFHLLTKSSIYTVDGGDLERRALGERERTRRRKRRAEPKED